MSDPHFHKERHFFLHRDERTLYCLEYLPEQPTPRQHGVILCKPIWGERIRTHRVFTNLARLLAKQGYSVITCDYYGDGNSQGDTLDLTFHGMVQDTVSLSHYFKEKHGVTLYSLIGLRIGATVAMSAAKRLEDVEIMILIDPILDLAGYLKDALRINLSNQMAVHKKILKNRDSLIQDIRNGIPANMDGFLIGADLWNSFETANPLQSDNQFKGQVTVLSLLDQGKKTAPDYSNLALKYKRMRLASIQKEFTWTDWKYHRPNPSTFFRTILAELTIDPLARD